MEKSSNAMRIVPLAQAPDVLTDILRQGAQQLLAQAIEAEVSDWMDRHQDCRDAAGHRQVVRNGHLPERTITTGVGAVTVQQPRVHDRRPADEREKFSSAILPPYLRKTKSLEELIPWLYLKGVRTGDFSEALAALLGNRHPIRDHPRHRIRDHRRTILAAGGELSPAGGKEEGCVRWTISQPSGRRTGTAKAFGRSPSCWASGGIPSVRP